MLWLVIATIYVVVVVVWLRWYLTKLFDDSPSDEDGRHHQLNHPTNFKKRREGEHD